MTRPPSIPTRDDPPNARAALAYARRGWRVLPLWWPNPNADGTCACGNPSCENVGKHPIGRLVPHGVKQATTDEATIRRWWQQEPHANVGIATGPESGLLVLDVDPRHGGDASLADLEAEHGTLPATPTVLTGGGGDQRYFHYPAGLDIRNSAGTLGPGLDIRGAGGYVVAPPSLHRTGRRYEWEILSHPDDVPLADPPAWLLDLCGRSAPRQQSNGAAPLIREGERNTRLTQIAGAMRRYGAGYEAISAALQAVNRAQCASPLDEGEVLKVAASISRYAPAARPQYPLTDLGNAERLVAGHGKDLRYCYAWSKWLTWDGTRWRPDDTGEVERRAKLTVRAIYLEAAECEDAETRKAVAAWARASESGHRIRQMITLAQSEPGVPVTPDDLDADPWLLNCPNGTVDLRTGELRSHRREDLLTKMAGAAYDPHAEAPLFQQFIERILPDPEVRRYLQKWTGYALTGVIREHRLPVWWGSGGNGKSTLIGALLGVLGDYGKQAAPDLLIVKQHDEHPTAIADLFGVRLVATIEVEEGRRLAETLAKQLTGGDRMKARFMRQDFFEWEPTHKLALICNHRPVIRGSDDGIWRRIDLVPFGVTIPEAEQDPELPTKLKAEYPGILRWMVEGCLLWQADGLGRPEAVRVATEQYRAEMDVLGEFVAERCVVKSSAWVEMGALYEAYVAWAQENGEQPLSKRTFGQRLRDRGIGEGRVGHDRRRCWLGIGLRPTPGPSTRPSNGHGIGDTRTDADVISAPPEGFRPHGDEPENLSASVRSTTLDHAAADAEPPPSAGVPPNGPCPRCGYQLSQHTCWKCQDTLCADCGRWTGSGLRTRCIPCAAKADQRERYGGGGSGG